MFRQTNSAIGKFFEGIARQEGEKFEGGQTSSGYMAIVGYRVSSIAVLVLSIVFPID